MRIRRPLSTPAKVFLHLTRRCNFRCRYCFVHAQNTAQSQELTIDRLQDLFDEFQRLHVLIVRFFGGEPLIRKDILQILDLLNHYTFSKTINTNGSFLTDEIACALKKAQFCWVNVSLDGPKKIHEQHSGVPGSFQRVVNGIESLVRHDINVGLECVLNRTNVHHITETLKIARELNVRHFRLLPLTPVGRACKSSSSDILSYDEWREFYLELTARKIEKSLPFNDISITFFNCNFCPWQMYYPLPEKQRKHLLKKAWDIDLDRHVHTQGGMHCTAGIDCCAILCNGDVFPCDQLMHIPSLLAGNINKRSLKSLWLHAKAFQRLRTLTRNDIIGPCSSCKNIYCSGLDPAAAFHTHGNIMHSDTNCVMIQK